MKKTKRNSRTIIDRAKAEVKGFHPMYARLEQKVQLGGLSESTLKNYGRCIAKISVHFGCPSHELQEEQINGYLQFLLIKEKPSRSYFKHTIYGLRFLFRVYGREDKALKLPSLKRGNPLPVVLSKKECKRLFKSGRILKHRVMLSLIHSAGLRSQEVRNLRWPDIVSRHRVGPVSLSTRPAIAITSSSILSDDRSGVVETNLISRR